MVAQVEGQASRASEMFRALAHRNFRLFWAGAFLSNAGTWMQVVAQGWLVLKLTDSPFWLGFDGFAATVPGLLLTLLGGVFADLVDRKRLLILTQIGSALTAFALATLMVTGVINDSSDVWLVLLLSLITGSCGAIAGPSYHAIAYDLVGREDLSNAIALNSMQFQLSRVLGPLLAGLTINLFGLAGCFFANALSYVAIVAALAQVRINDKKTDADLSELIPPSLATTNAAATPARSPTVSSANGAPAPAHSMRDRRALWQDLVEGFRYVGKRPRVRLLILSSAVISLFGAPYLTLIPLFARDIYGWGEVGLSLLMGTAGVGAFLGALVLAYLGDFRRKGLVVLGGMFWAALCLIGFALASNYYLALLLLCGVGFSMVSFFAVSNMYLQQLVTDEMRGRVMSIWILAFIGTMPFGSFFSGLAAERIGAPLTLFIGGLFIIAFVLFIGLRPEARKLVKD